jgi:hypothetical protein
VASYFFVAKPRTNDVRVIHHVAAIRGAINTGFLENETADCVKGAVCGPPAARISSSVQLTN